MANETSVTKRLVAIWLVITRLRFASDQDIFGNYLVKALTKDEAVQAVKEKCNARAEIEYVTSSFENPLLIRGTQFDKCAVHLDIDSETYEAIYKFCDIDIS